MPLVLFVGLPASGKTTRAKQLLAHLQQHLFPQQLDRADESKQSHSLPSPPTLQPSTQSTDIDDNKDSSHIDQLSALSLTDPPPSTQPPITAPTPTPTPAAYHTATASTSSDSSFVKSTAPAKPVSTASSTSPSTPSSPITELVLINHESLQLPRSTFYSSPQHEKAGRSAIRAAVERHLSSSRVLLVDYVNDIKGFRYELWCRAREMGSTYCVVYCDVPKERCVEWNKQRPLEEQYTDAVSDTRTHARALR